MSTTVLLYNQLTAIKDLIIAAGIEGLGDGAVFVTRLAKPPQSGIDCVTINRAPRTAVIDTAGTALFTYFVEITVWKKWVSGVPYTHEKAVEQDLLTVSSVYYAINQKQVGDTYFVISSMYDAYTRDKESVGTSMLGSFQHAVSSGGAESVE